MSLETWAVAAVAIVDSAGTPLIIRTYLSPPSVRSSAECPSQAHLYVGPEDIIGLHFLLFSSLDRSEELVISKKQQIHAAATRTVAQGESASLYASPFRDDLKEAMFSTTTAREESGVRLDAAEGGLGNAFTNFSEPYPSSSSPQRLVTSTTDVRFLGKLIHSYRFLSYGFCSATAITTLLVTVGGEAPSDAVVPLCRAIYECVSAALCNPFRTPAQCWRTQVKLFEENYASGAGEEHDFVVQETSGVAEMLSNQVTKSGYAGAIRLPSTINLGLPPETQEFSWPGTPPTLAALSQEPTLALSKTFNRQLESILSTFTVTSRSRMID